MNHSFKEISPVISMIAAIIKMMRMMRTNPAPFLMASRDATSAAAKFPMA